MEIQITNDFSGYDMVVTGVSEGDSFTATPDFSGKCGETYVAAPDKLLLGLGKPEDKNLRKAVTKAVKKLQCLKIKSAVFEFEADEQVVLGAMIANYTFDKYKSEKSDKLEKIAFAGGDAGRAQIFADAMQLTRDIANEPAQYATPTRLAQIAQGITGIETRVFEKPEIEGMKMGAFLAVGQGSVQPPKFIHMKYSPANPKKKIALVGKGICFDSGGLDIKPASSMLTMAGAACVLGVMSALEKLSPDVEVHGIIAACENMPGGKSYKPGDILTAKNGKTIEVDNTDAEGRLTLADALCYAEELGVDEIVDVATLTGACKVALGTLASGIMGNNEEFIAKLVDTAKENGERFWPLPMYKEFKESLKSTVADMKNTGSRWGGASTAGVFLNEFVKDTAWAHIDIAGTAFLEKPQEEFICGSTGVGVRTLLNYLFK